MEPINLKSISGSASPTTRVKLGITLNSEQDSIQGTGDSISLTNNNTKNRSVSSQDLILPDSKINIGDKIHLNTDDINNSFKFGGLSFSGNFAGNNTIAGAAAPDNTFESFVQGDSMTISDTEGNEITLIYHPTPGNANEFKDMDKNFKARIDNTDDGRLYIGPSDATRGINFENITGGIPSALGLFDVAAEENRFNSKESLQSVIHSTNALTARDESGTVKFSAASPTTSLSTGATHGEVTWNATATGNTITVNHTNHGLSDDNWIYITDFNGTNGFKKFGPEKAVKVTNVTANTFDIDTSDADNHVDGGPLTAANDGESILKHGTNFKWQETVGNASITSPATQRVETTNGSSSVKMYVKDKNLYNVGDVFSFKNIGTDGTDEINGINFSESHNYDITEVNTDLSGNHYIMFKANNEATAGGATDKLDKFAINRFHSVFTEFGLNPNKFNYGQSYHPDGGSKGANFSEGANNALQTFNSKALTLFDSLGTPHNFRVSFGKLSQHHWAVEIHATENSDGSFDIASNRTDGQVANGTISFNPDGSLAEVSDSLSQPIQIDWANQAETSQVKFDWGTAGPIATSGAQNPGKMDGMSQVATNFNKKFIETNGIAPGLLNSVTIDQEGFVIAGFNNGTSKKVFKIPLADFANVNGLSEITGNAYTESNRSGSFNLSEAATAGMGKITAESLEQSNVDTSEEITGLIQANQTYQANTKVIKTETEKFEALNRVT